MSDLIEREDAIKDFADYLREADLLKCDGRLYPMEHYLKKAERHMKRIPSARPKGEWIVLGGTDFNGISYCAKCSNCKAVYDGIRLSNYSYCPNCGADMRGVDDGNK